VLHSEWVNSNSPLTPESIVIEGNVPHFGEISSGSNGHIAPGDAEVHAKNKFEIFNISPQV
jgi:hypothetical protein